MRHYKQNHSQSRINNTACNPLSLKSSLIKYHNDQNQTATYQTDQSSILLNGLSFRESTVAHADPLNLDAGILDNPQSTDNISNSMDSSILELLMKQNIATQQNNIIFEKRDLVVNWIALIHTKYWFEQETFHLAVNILDRYLLSKQLKHNIDFQLLAVTAFWMAAKIEERKIKELKVWMKLGRGFTRDDILEMETKILQVLDYQIIQSTSQTIFWELVTNYTSLPSKSVHLALYILELSMMSISYRKFEQEIIALASIYLSSKIHGIQQSELPIHNLFLNYWDSIRKCSRKLCKTLQKSVGNMKSPIVRKFGSKKYNQISYMKLGKKSDSITNTRSQSTVLL